MMDEVVSVGVVLADGTAQEWRSGADLIYGRNVFDNEVLTKPARRPYGI